MGNVTILKASAGSGKTYRLVWEYISAVVEDPALYRHILAVTFTNKATAEMKERIVRQLHALASGADSPYLEGLAAKTGWSRPAVREKAGLALHNILHDYSRFQVVTIDRFFQGIIRSFMRELGISLDFNIELKTSTLLEAAADALVERTSSDPDLKRWVAGFADEQAVAGKNWDVRRKLAEAGEELFGEEWGVDPGEEERRRARREKLEAAMKAADAEKARVCGRMQAAAARAMEIIDGNSLSPADFYQSRSGVGAFLQRTAEGAIAPRNTYVDKALEGDGGWYSQKSPHKEQIKALIPALRPLLEEICRTWDEEHRAIYSAAALERRYRTFGLLDEMAHEVSQLCAERNIMPIARTNHIIRKLTEGNGAPFIFEKAGNHYSRFLIDEFQDTSSMQWGNFVPLLQNALSQSAGQPVLLVGDVKQSIYRWRGGDWRILAAGAGAALGDAREEALGVNYRSLPVVVEFVNTLMEECVGRDADYLERIAGEAAAKRYINLNEAEYLSGMPRAAYAGHGQTTPEGKRGGYVTLTMARPGDESGKDALVERVEELQRRGFGPSEIAILVRRRNEAQQVARTMLAYKAANPDSPYSYDVVTAEALYIGSSPAVEFLAACMGLAADPGDDVGRAVWNRHAGRPFGEQLPPEEKEFLASAAATPPQECFRRILMRYGDMAGGGQIAYVQAFEEQIVRFCNSGVADLQLLLEWWREEGSTESVYMPENGSAIRIMTIHAAKGLEFGAVILPYCSWGLAPRADSPVKVSSDEEPFRGLERLSLGFTSDLGRSAFASDYYNELVMSHIDNINLLYVALTRAREELHIYMARKADRQPGKDDKFVTVGDLIADAADMSGARIGGMKGEACEAGEGRSSITFGQPVRRTACVREDSGGIDVGYPTRDPGLRVRLRFPSQRYTDGGETPPALTPRSYGVMMHRIFEKAASRDDIAEAVRNLARDGAISAEEAARLAEMTEQAMADPLIGGWFDGSWQTVRNENEIIMPGEGAGVRRPDRVMVKGRRAVVVDYKFGEKDRAGYRSQITAYKDILARMGYQPVEGYIWYVSLGKAEQV